MREQETREINEFSEMIKSINTISVGKLTELRREVGILQKLYLNLSVDVEEIEKYSVDMRRRVSDVQKAFYRGKAEVYELLLSILNEM